MPTVASLDVLLSADVSKFSAGLAAAGKSLFGFKAGPIALASEAIKELGAAFIGVVEKLDAAGDRAANLGVAVEELTRLQFAAEKLGGSAAMLDRGLSELQKRMPDIAAGTGAAAEAIERLGINAATFVTLDPATAFRMVAAAMERLPSTTEKTAAAYGLFGKAAKELFAVLNSGSHELAEQSRLSDELGNTITAAEAAAGDAAKGGLLDLQAAWNGFTQALTKFIPIANLVMDIIGGIIVGFDRLFELLGKLSSSIFTALGMPPAIESDMAALAEATRKQQAEADAAFAAQERLAEERERNEEAAREAAEQAAAAMQRESELAAENAAAEALREQERAARDAADAQRELADAAMEVWKNTRTPAEAAALEIDRLNGLFVQGYLDADTFARRLSQMHDEFATPESVVPTLSASAGGSLEAGTAAAMSALIEARNEKPAEKEIPKQQLMEQQRSRALLDRIAKAIEELTGNAVAVGAP